MEAVHFVLGGLPQRHLLSFLCLVGFSLISIMRTLPEAMRPYMMKEPFDVGKESTDCKGHRYEHMNESVSNELDWPIKLQQLTTSAFIIGYGITLTPGGMIADKYGAKHVIGTSGLAALICTALYPTVAKISIYPVFVTRFMHGFWTGGIVPGLTSLIARWSTPSERFIFAGFILGGFSLSSMVGEIWIASMSEYHWSNTFYTVAGATLIWYIVWNVWAYSEPASHPFITEKELEFLRNNIEGISDRKKIPLIPPLKKIVTSPPVIGMSVCFLGQVWCILTIENEVPGYLTEVIKLPRIQLLYVNMIESFGSWIVALLAAWFGTYWYKVKNVELTEVRKLLTGVAAFIPALSFIAASYEGCHRYTILVVLTFGVWMTACFYTGVGSNALDLSPNFAGTVMALANTAYIFLSLVHPMIINILSANNTLKEWRRIFWICFYIDCGTFLVYLVYASGDIQEWNEIDEEGL